MSQTGDHPTSTAYWDLDEETGEVLDVGYETRW